jgi:hypothetical protein
VDGGGEKIDVYFKEDIQQGIVAVAIAMLSASVAHGSGNVEYCRGILDTSRAQAMNYGLGWHDILTDLRSTLVEARRGELLELLAKVIPAVL